MLKVRDFADFLEVDDVYCGGFKKVTGVAGRIFRFSTAVPSSRRGCLVALSCVATLATLLEVSAAEAQIGKQKGFDAVGGGSQSAMSFAGDTGVALRFYPHGSKPGFGASSSFQSMNRSALFRRLEGMEGSIWGQNIWASQNKKKTISRQELERTASRQTTRQMSKEALRNKANRSSTGYMKGPDPFQSSRRDRKLGTSDSFDQNKLMGAASTTDTKKNGAKSKSSKWFKHSKPQKVKNGSMSRVRSRDKASRKSQNSQHSSTAHVRDRSQLSTVGHARNSQATGKEWWAL